MTWLSTFDLSTLPDDVRFIGRDEWGLDDAEADRRGMNVQPDDLTKLYYHHTAGSTPDVTSATWDDDPIRMAQVMDERARTGNNGTVYKATAYSALIHTAPSGITTIIEARGDRYPGATKGRNSRSKAICFVANFMPSGGASARRPPRPGELSAGRWLTNKLTRTGILASDRIARGHRDNPSYPNATSCPGDWMTDDMITMMATPVTHQPATPSAPGQLVPVTPYRNSDTRVFGLPLGADTSTRFDLKPASQVPRTAQAILANVTAVDARGNGFLTVWQGGRRPSTSNVNYANGDAAVPNLALIQLDGYGFEVYTHAPCHVLVDVQGYIG